MKNLRAKMHIVAVLSLLLQPTGSLLLRPTAAPAAPRIRCAAPVAIDVAADSVTSPPPCAPEKCETACDKDAPPRMARVPKAITSQPVARSPDAAPAIERVAGPFTASMPPPDDLARPRAEPVPEAAGVAQQLDYDSGAPYLAIADSGPGREARPRCFFLLCIPGSVHVARELCYAAACNSK